MGWIWCTVWVCICIVFMYISYRAYLVDIRKTNLTEMAMARMDASHQRELESYKVLLKAERKINERLKKELSEKKKEEK